MRYVTVWGLDDDLRFDLSNDVSIVALVMERGEGVSDLIYRWICTGTELIAFAKENRLTLPDGILENGRYRLTAYDW
ncbi:MAG: hypothetical protein IJW58_04005 [Clostridia bacterium]|nr:hypothetical protein [Clostridia bacterium]